MNKANVFFSLCAPNWPLSLSLSLFVCLPSGWRGGGGGRTDFCGVQRRDLSFVAVFVPLAHTCSTRAVTSFRLYAVEISGVALPAAAERRYLHLDPPNDHSAAVSL